MILVSEIIEEAESVFGICDRRILLKRITESVELLAGKGDISPLIGYVDLCVQGRCVTLPEEVETVISLNICGHPAIGRDELWNFHMNGPGEGCQSCDYSWMNEGPFPTYRDIICPVKLVAFVERQEDEGSMLRVFGYDSQGRPLRTDINGQWEDGLLVPTLFSYALPASSDPVVSRITGIVKDRTVANVRLSSFDNSTSTGTLLGIFEPNTTKPSYRRIKLNHCGPWVRLCYRKKSLELYSLNDRILLHSRPALILAFWATKKYHEADIATAVQFESQATRILTEKESIMTSPINSPIQVNDRNSIKIHPCEDLD